MDTIKKHIPIVVLCLFIGMLLYWSNIIWQQQEEQRQEAAYEKEQHLVVYSDMPDNVNSDLAKRFYERYHMRVQIMTKSDEAIQTFLASDAPSAIRPDFIIAVQPILQKGTELHWFSGYTSVATETVPYSFKEADGYWCGVWFDPMVWVVNVEYFTKHGYMLQNWKSLIIDPDIRLAFPDLAATDMASDYLCSFVEAKGQEEALLYFKEVQRHVPIYSKSMSLSARRVALGEADIGVVDSITAWQYAKDQIPLQIIYPQEGTTYWMIGAAITQWNGNAELAGQFMDWLLSADAMHVVRKDDLYLFSASDVQQKELDMKGQSLTLFPIQKQYTEQGRKELTDWWIKSVRFGKES